MPTALSRKANDSRMASSSSMTCTTGLSDGIADLLLGHRPQREAKGRAAGGVGARSNLSAMGLDNGAGNRQADAHAVAFVGDEGLEQMSRYVRRNPRAGVRDADSEHTVLVGGGRNRELAPLRGFHGFDGVAQQVEQNLLNLHLVGEDEVDGGVELKTHPNALILGADESQSAGFLDELLDAFDPALALSARHELAQAADDLTRAQSLLRGLVHGIAKQGGA